MKSILVKLIVLMVVFAGVLIGGLWTYQYFQLEAARTRWLTDPALDFIAAAEPPELKGLARKINQFTRLPEAITIAGAAGFHCEMPRYDELPSGYNGPRVVVCPHGNEEIRKGGKVLVLRSWFPRDYMRGLELRQLDSTASPPSKPADVAAQAQLIAAAKGVEFPTAAMFADVVADRLSGFYYSNCVGDEIPRQTMTQCLEFRERRTRDGPPKWDGKPVTAGKHENAMRVLTELGLDCGKPGFIEAASRDQPDIATVVCETRSFGGQVQSISLETDARTVIPQALIVTLSGQTQRIALVGQPPGEDNPQIVSIMVKTLLGEPQILTIAPYQNDNSLDRAAKSYANLDAGSQRRLTHAMVAQAQSLLAAPNEPPPAPELQRLDVTAALLARLGADAVALAAEDLSGLSISTIAAIALASCRVNAEAADCLKKFVAAQPALRSTLVAALDEAKQFMPELPVDHPVRARFTRLAAQIAAAEK